MGLGYKDQFKMSLHTPQLKLRKTTLKEFKTYQPDILMLPV